LPFPRQKARGDRVLGRACPIIQVGLSDLLGTLGNRSSEEYQGKSDMSDVADRMKKIVVEHLGVDEAKVVEDASFIDDLGADSLDTVELIMAFEEEFDIEIPDDAVEKIATVKDAITFVSNKQS